MTERLALMPPEIWLAQMFASRAARDGGVVRRKVRDVERIVGRARFEAELTRRGYRAVENAGQFVIFCNREPLRIIADGAPQNPSQGFCQEFSENSWPAPR